LIEHRTTRLASASYAKWRVDWGEGETSRQFWRMRALDGPLALREITLRYCMVAD